jgi:hypothetical protein
VACRLKAENASSSSSSSPPSSRASPGSAMSGSGVAGMEYGCFGDSERAPRAGDADVLSAEKTVEKVVDACRSDAAAVSLSVSNMSLYGATDDAAPIECESLSSSYIARARRGSRGCIYL